MRGRHIADPAVPGHHGAGAVHRQQLELRARLHGHVAAGGAGLAVDARGARGDHVGGVRAGIGGFGLYLLQAAHGADALPAVGVDQRGLALHGLHVHHVALGQRAQQVVRRFHRVDLQRLFIDHCLEAPGGGGEGHDGDRPQRRQREAEDQLA